MFRMEVSDLNTVKEDERGKMYDCGKFKLVCRKKGSISADHIHDRAETNFLIDGEIELTIGDEVKVIKAPVKIEIPRNTYHKILALTDIKLTVNE